MPKITAIFIALLIGIFAAVGPAMAKTCELSISGNDQIEYNKSELVVPADCDRVKLTLKHVGQLPVEQMGHNWVLTKTEHFRTVSQQGSTAGLKNDYLPQDEQRIIAYTDLIGGGQSDSITFDVSQLKSGGDYTFFCSFPGHTSNMKGKLVVK